MINLKLLEYLKEQGPTNTFKLVRVLGMDRGHLLDMINKLEAKGTVTMKGGIVQFLRFLPEEKKVPPKKSKSRKKAPQIKKPAKPRPESKIAERLPSEESLEGEKENSVLKNKLAEAQMAAEKQSHYIQELEVRIKTLEKEVQAAPSIQILSERKLLKQQVEEQNLKIEKLEKKARDFKKIKKR